MAINLTKIYTKGGDKGETSLVCGKRVSKGSTRVITYGISDELGSHLGMLKTLVLQSENKEIKAYLDKMSIIQQQLFNLGSLIATEDKDLYQKIKHLSEKDVEFLEQEIDKMNKELKPLTSFVLPGGSFLNSQAHICRTVCRRLESNLVGLGEEAELDSVLIQYVNRLSDWFFVVSRWFSLKEDTAEFLWTKEAQIK